MGGDPGVAVHAVTQPDIAALRLPIVYCDADGTQLVQRWFVVCRLRQRRAQVWYGLTEPKMVLIMLAP
jgi:hypothetical protein